MKDNYFKYFKPNLYFYLKSVTRFFMLIMMVNALILYYNNSPDLLKLTYWLGYVKIIVAFILVKAIQQTSYEISYANRKKQHVL